MNGLLYLKPALPGAKLSAVTILFRCGIFMPLSAFFLLWKTRKTTLW